MDFSSPAKDVSTEEPVNPKSRLLRAIELRRSGLAGDAANLLILALRDDPEAADHYFELGNTRKVMGDTASSGAQFRRALTIRPDFPQALTNLGGLSRGLDAPEVGMRHCERAGILLPAHCGVLHHMDSSVAGWRVLVDRLRPGGVTKIGLYKELARREIVKAQATGLSTMVTAQDFFTMSEFRNLVFHVQEHRFSLPRIQVILEVLGLRFLGFEISDALGAKRFRELHSEPSALA